MNQFEVNIDNVKLYTSDNYYAPLGITDDRAKYLISKVKDAFTADADEEGMTINQVDVFRSISKEAENKEELLFLSYKAGEIAGMLQCGNDHSIPVLIALELMEHRAFKKLGGSRDN